MIEAALEKWFEFIHGEGAEERNSLLDELLAEDVVFYSPVVFTPQRGRAAAKLYLMAAGSTFGGDESPGSSAADPNQPGGGFHYSKRVTAGNHAILEFETTMGGKYVNGVDIITCNDSGKVVEFKVMIRPLQAINIVHTQMAAMLKQLQGGSHAA